MSGPGSPAGGTIVPWAEAKLRMPLKARDSVSMIHRNEGVQAYHCAHPVCVGDAALLTTITQGWGSVSAHTSLPSNHVP